MTTEADKNYIGHTYAKCKKCGWIHFYDWERPDAPWKCFRCRTEGKEAFDLVKDSELTEKDCPRGVTIQPVNW